MKSTKQYLTMAFIVACSVLLVIPLWAIFGVLLPDAGGHGAHGAAEMVSPMQFQGKVDELIEYHGLPDGSVEADGVGPVYIMASQYTFTPSTIRLKTGQRYQVQILSSDVVHSISVQMNGTSYNSVIMPMMVTGLNLSPTEPGTYLVICNEYCGLGHDYMYFTIIVEPGEEHEDEEEHSEDEDKDKDGHTN